MVNNEVKTMGAKRKRGRAGQRVTHVNGFHPHISPHYYIAIYRSELKCKFNVVHCNHEKTTYYVKRLSLCLVSN